MKRKILACFTAAILLAAASPALECLALQDRSAEAKELAERLDAAEDEVVRIALLERIAALADSEGDEPSPSVAMILAASLGDESLEVRKKAALLLGTGQDPQVARQELLGALDKVREEADAIFPEYKRLFDLSLNPAAFKGMTPEEIEKLGKGPKSEKEKEEMLKRLAEFANKAKFATEMIKEAGKLQKELDGILSFGTVLAGSLGRLADEEVAEKVRAFFTQVVEQRPQFAPDLADVLLDFGDRRSIDAIVKALDRFETLHREAEKYELERSRNVTRKKKKPLVYPDSLRDGLEWGTSLHEKLIDFAKPRKLKGTPQSKWRPGTAIKWRGWYKRNAKDAFPEEISSGNP